LPSRCSLPRTTEGLPVHFFPCARSQHRNVVFLVCVLALGAAPLAGASATADGTLEDRRSRVTNQVEAAADDLEGSSRAARESVLRLRAARAQLAAARAQWAEARSALAAAIKRDELMQARLQAAEERLAAAKTKLDAARVALEQQRVAVSQLISSIYTEGDPEVLALSALLRSETTADLIRQRKIRDVIVGTETANYEDLAVAEKALEAKKVMVRTVTLEVADRRREAAEQLTLRQDLEATAAAGAREVKALVGARSSARVAARRAVRADRRELSVLRAHEQRIEAILARRAEQARQQAVSNGSPTSGGSLAYPVSGPVTSPFGYRTHPIYGYWGLHNGVDFASGCGAPMYAAASGRVIASYYQSAYGNRLIIDHGYVRGVGLASIYNHATSYVVGQGADVRRGQVIGYVGSTGWSTGCHLHFTVMADGRPVDPQRWF
ncbi:MAG: peptidoglycan DD-metalloendopeptidase family protein, partial [Nocardioides sp.]